MSQATGVEHGRWRARRTGQAEKLNVSERWKIDEQRRSFSD
jgi:hypothetical protein